MKVTKSFQASEPGRTIEIGHPTWDKESPKFSVRSRRQNRNGGFKRGSPEIPIGDIPGLIEAIAHEDLLQPADIAAMIATLANSSSRQLGR